MLAMKLGILGEIVQAIPQHEEQALTMGFGCTLGWGPELADEAEAPIFDACLPGGTGRFSGQVSVDSRVEPEEE